MKLMDMGLCCRPSKKKCSPRSQQELGGFPSKNIRLFSYNELRTATENFHPSKKIGRGGFGTVYKGILRDGMPIAAKVLSAESRQGANEFLTEIDIITNVRHPNLVELVGCCCQGSSRILVYELVENNSLHHLLLGSKSEPGKINWAMRSEICIGTARGLAYLHEELEPHIVHRDIKATNILLGRNFVPKIGDFGLAKLFPDNITHISTRVAGTTGYLAPEYALQGQLTKKADIYSFGVLILEVVSGRSSSRSYWSDLKNDILEYTWELYTEGRLLELVDSTLTDFPEEEVLRYMKIALFCTQAVASRRPTTLQVVEMLSKPIRLIEKHLTPPGLVVESRSKSKGSKSKGSRSKSKGSTTTSSSESHIKDSSYGSTVVEFTSTPVTITQMLPR